VHAVAFDLSAREAKAIECIARETGGRFLQANDAASLKDALELAVVETVVAAAPRPRPARPRCATSAARATACSPESTWWSPQRQSKSVDVRNSGGGKSAPFGEMRIGAVYFRSQ